MSEQEMREEGHITPRMSGREQVGRTADRLRDELLLTLEELERRRTRALDVPRQLRRILGENREVLRKVGGVALGLLVLGVGYSRWEAHRRKRRLWARRRTALRRVWEHPERVASLSKERPLPVELGHKLVLIFATALATALAKNAAERLVPLPPRRGLRGGVPSA